jgi:hypothetical protein
MEAEELAAQKREFERERALARARAARERKARKEEEERGRRRREGVPEKSRWVRQSQGRITGFWGLGKRGREGEEGGEEEPERKKAVLEDVGEDEEDRIDGEGQEAEEVAVELSDEEEGVEDLEEPERKKAASEDVCEDEEDNTEDQQAEEAPVELPDEPHAEPEEQAQEQAAEQTHEQAEEQAAEQTCEEAEGQLEEQVHEHMQDELQDPQLPPIEKDLIASQDFIDDDEIFEELATQQLLSESSAAAERSQARNQSSPNLPRQSTLKPTPFSANKTFVAPSPRKSSSPSAYRNDMPMGPPSSPPKKITTASQILQQQSRASIQFACSGLSPELTSSNPFSEKQALSRSIDKATARKTNAAASVVMGPPPSPFTGNNLTSSRILSPANKQVSAPLTVNALSQRSSRRIPGNSSASRQPLREISQRSQNFPLKAFSTPPKYAKPALKGSLFSNKATAKSPSFALPTSTQLFLNEHFNDFFPSPSQQMRELLDDIDDDDIPTNTQVAREIQLDDVAAELPLVLEPAKAGAGADDDFSWLSTQDLVLSSQELRELETPSKAAPPPPPTPWDVRRARKPRFFQEKEGDLVAAAQYESLLQARKDEQARKLWEENARIEMELLGQRQPTQRSTTRVARSSQAVKKELGQGRADLKSSRCSQTVKMSQKKAAAVKTEEEDYGDDDFDDAEAEATMLALADEAEKMMVPRKAESEDGEEEFDDWLSDDYDAECDCVEKFLHEGCGDFGSECLVDFLHDVVGLDV